MDSCGLQESCGVLWKRQHLWIVRSLEIGEPQDWGSAKESSSVKKLKIITRPLFYKNRGAGQVINLGEAEK